MKRIVLCGLALGLLMGCGTKAFVPQVTTAKYDAYAGYVPEVAFFEDETAIDEFVVYRFSGDRLEQPVMMSQRVVERHGDMALIDVELDTGRDVHRLRLRMRGGELVSVAKVEDGVQLPFGLVAYQALMSDVVLDADENIGEVGRGEATISVAGMPLQVSQTAYRVRVGEREAIMTTYAAEGFSWGDVGGEMRALDGTLLYKAEIVDIGGGEMRTVAHHEDDDFYDDFDHFEE